jgi:hypothetical protein
MLNGLGYIEEIYLQSWVKVWTVARQTAKQEAEREEDHLQNLHKVSQRKSMPCTGLPVVASNGYTNAGKRVTCLFLARQSPAAQGLLILRSLDHTRHITLGRTPLDEWLARRRDLHLTTHNTHHRHTSMPPVGFETTISAGERPQTYALDRAASGTGGKRVTAEGIHLRDI